ncbi:hypothetical protein RJT34_22633 [Clitoria ternatea]|uniref:Uncharacterized protein n=1 Tax=Clitoria ternatea TaxID=43366 RepID=A0AAN9FRB8_CLITE
MSDQCLGYCFGLKLWCERLFIIRSSYSLLSFKKISKSIFVLWTHSTHIVTKRLLLWCGLGLIELASPEVFSFQLVFIMIIIHEFEDGDEGNSSLEMFLGPSSSWPSNGS